MGDEVESAGDAGRAQARAQARTAIETILAQSEFQQSAASKWRDRLQERVGKWFEEVMARFGGGRGAARTTALVFAWAAALAALIGLGFWTARTIADRPRGASLGLGSACRVPPTRARAGAARASPRRARGTPARPSGVPTARLWCASRSRASGASMTPERRASTCRCSRQPTNRHSAVLDLTRRFEQIWYGNRAAGADDAASCDRSPGGSRMPASWRTSDLTVLAVAGRGHRAPDRAPRSWLPPPDSLPRNDGSSYAAHPDGARAAYLLLKGLGYDVERSFEPVAALRHVAGADDARAGESLRRTVGAGRQGAARVSREGRPRARDGSRGGRGFPARRQSPPAQSAKTASPGIHGSLGRDGRTAPCPERSPTPSSQSRWRRRLRRSPADSPYVVVYGSEQAPAVLSARVEKGASHVVGELGAAGKRGDWTSEARRAAREYARSARRADDTLGRVLSRSHALVLVVHFRHAVLRGHHAGPRDRRARALHLRPASSADPRPGRRAPDVAARVRRYDGRSLRAGTGVDGGRRDGARARPSPAPGRAWPAAGDRR